MIINQSQIAMSSQRNFVRKQTDTFTIGKEEVKPTKGGSFLDMLGQISDNESEGITNNYSPSGIGSIAKDVSGLSDEDNTKLTFQTLSYLMHLLFFKQMGGSNDSLSDMMLEYQGSTPPMYRLNMTHTSSYYESETTTFSTTGKVVTADGREIDFGVDLSMSRTFYAENMESIQTNLQYIDPLVINLDSNPTSVSDMKFEFDLDADGEAEEISYLLGGGAFLALDKNNNGEIDDGSELFGTSSGDGFKDLSEYDTDGNGWIDEADDVFDKLRLWQVNADGSKSLYTLKDKNVGALYLGNVNSQFSLTNENNNTNAMIRKSGIYLTEDGNVGTMAHVDLVS
ncbi:MAG: hypothetical protein K5644_01180 [Lachnospiraceae bacterium]|nr:hypothetical protein [Lachnospiraceae bacterium]